jgi:DNA-binding response OmpR family regulator
MATTRVIRPDAVLLVEDHEQTRATYKEWVESAGFVVIEASTKAMALMHLDRLDLSAIVLDLILPNGHGREVVDTLVAKRDDVPVVVVTGFPDPPVFGFPVTCVLRKPFPRGMFLSALNAAAETGRSMRSIQRSTRVLHERCNRPLAELPPEDTKL